MFLRLISHNMETIKLGTLRFIQIFDQEAESEGDCFLGYIKAFGLQHAVKTVIGSINEMDPIVKLNSDKHGIYVHDAVDSKFILIARDEHQLNNLISLLKNIWEPFQNTDFLPRTDDTMLQCKLFLKELEKMPGETNIFWLKFAFREFNINYEL